MDWRIGFGLLLFFSKRKYIVRSSNTHQLGELFENLQWVLQGLRFNGFVCNGFCDDFATMVGGGGGGGGGKVTTIEERLCTRDHLNIE